MITLNQATIDLTTVERLDLLNLGEFLNINNRDFKLLLEAYRRKNVLQSPTPKSYRDWLGNGSTSQYKSRYFKPLGEAKPKVNNLYILTERGVEALKAIESLLPIPRETKTIDRLNKVLYSF